MVKNKTKSKADGFKEMSLAEHDKIFNIDSETRKELNKSEGWITNTDKPVFGRKNVEKLNKKKPTKTKVKKTVTTVENEAGTEEIRETGGEIELA